MINARGETYGFDAVQVKPVWLFRSFIKQYSITSVIPFSTVMERSSLSVITTVSVKATRIRLDKPVMCVYNRIREYKRQFRFT